MFDADQLPFNVDVDMSATPTMRIVQGPAGLRMFGDVRDRAVVGDSRIRFDEAQTRRRENARYAEFAKLLFACNSSRRSPRVLRGGGRPSVSGSWVRRRQGASCA